MVRVFVGTVLSVVFAVLASFWIEVAPHAYPEGGREASLLTILVLVSGASLGVFWMIMDVMDRIPWDEPAPEHMEETLEEAKNGGK